MSQERKLRAISVPLPEISPISRLATMKDLPSTVSFKSILSSLNNFVLTSIKDATGLSSSLASNRLSWFYNLRGPSMTIDTACSSSLTAFHLACQSIRTGEAEMVSTE